MKLTPPKQYQLGYTEFYKLKFKITPDVLIPRPETELIVDFVLAALGDDSKLGFNLAKKIEIGSGQKATLVEVGTGSGCIAISVAKNNKDVKIVAIDISSKALAIAKKNAEFHHLSSRIFLIENNLLTGFKQPPDIIVANLPYIPSARLMLIDPMVREFEPKIALDGGNDGFELYRNLLNQIKNQQIEPKLFVGEIDSEHSEIALNFAKRLFPTAQTEIKKDLAKKDRFLVISF